MRKACCSAVRGGNVKRAATLVESPGNRFSDAGSIPAISTKRTSVELRKNPGITGIFVTGFAVEKIKHHAFERGAFFISAFRRNKSPGSTGADKNLKK